jgi:hypothetical protein
MRRPLKRLAYSMTAATPAAPAGSTIRLKYLWQICIADRSETSDTSHTSSVVTIHYLFFPKEETGYDLPISHPNIGRWLSRVSETKGWKLSYDLMPGKRTKALVWD